MDCPRPERSRSNSPASSDESTASELVLSATIVGTYRGSPAMKAWSDASPAAAWMTSSYAGLLP
jgi:hypothetical protein